MTHLSRKDFVRLTSWGIIAALLPINRVEALNTILSPREKNPSNDFQNAVFLASEARTKFYLKEYALAESLYLQAIGLAPKYIQFYDGLDNVFGAQNKYMDSVYLYHNALSLNPGYVAFYDRAARSLMRLQTGYRHLAVQYQAKISSASLLADAVSLYNKAITIDPGKNYLLIGLAKVKHKIDIAPLQDDYRENQVFKKLKVINRNKYKVAINNKTKDEILILIRRLDLKTRRTLMSNDEIVSREVNIANQKKKFYKILLSRIDIANPERMQFAQELFQIDNADPTSLAIAKRTYYANKKFYDFITIRKKFAEASQTFHSYLGLMDTMELAVRNGQANKVILEDALAIGITLKNDWSLLFNFQVHLAVKMVKIYLLQSRYSEAKNLMEEVITQGTVQSSSTNNQLIYYYSKIYFQEGNLEFAKNSLLLGVKELDSGLIEQLTAESPQLLIIQKLASNKTNDTFADNLDLYYLLNNTYLALGEMENSANIMQRLLANNPADSFVLSKT